MKLPNKRRALELTERVASVVAECSDDGGVPADTCILQTRLAQLVLERHSVPSTPVPVFMRVRHAPTGRVVQVGTGATTRPDIYPGHLILRVRTAFLLDMTPGQIELPGMPRLILAFWPKADSDGWHGMQRGELAVAYQANGDYSFADDGWRDLATDPLIDRLAERV